MPHGLAAIVSIVQNLHGVLTDGFCTRSRKAQICISLSWSTLPAKFSNEKGYEIRVDDFTIRTVIGKYIKTRGNT